MWWGADPPVPLSAKACAGTALLRELAHEREQRRAVPTAKAQSELLPPAGESSKRGSKVDTNEEGDKSRQLAAAVQASRVGSSVGDGVGATTISKDSSDEKANGTCAQADKADKGTRDVCQENGDAGAATPLNSTSNPHSAPKKTRRLKVKVMFQITLGVCSHARSHGAHIKHRHTVTFIPTYPRQVVDLD